MRVLDAGLSTGGFTDCLLQRGASHVVGVDVGYGQVSRLAKTVSAAKASHGHMQLSCKWISAFHSGWDTNCNTCNPDFLEI